MEGMKPTRWHYFYASSAIRWFWIFGPAGGCAASMALYLRDVPEFATSFYKYVALAGAFGMCVAALIAPFLLAPLYRRRIELNGAPYKEGDRVWILAGRHRDKIGVVEKIDWAQYTRVHVKLDELVETFEEVQLLKISPEPTST